MDKPTGINRVRAWAGRRLFLASCRVWGEHHEVTVLNPSGDPVFRFFAYWDWSGVNVDNGYDFDCVCGADALREV
jgi:hypothetical protein